MFFGIAVFLLGSVLCGIAWSMPALIFFRALQGIGAGAVQPMSITMVGDLYSVEERARVQGYVASVWGAASVIGPTLGGVFSEYLSWRWIFFINLPLGAIAAWVLARRFKEQVKRSSHKIDYVGAALLTASSSLIILGLLEGGVAWSWVSVPSVLILTMGVVLAVVFVLMERRAAEPILPLWVFRHRTLTGGNLVSLCIGALMIGLSSYVPTYAEGVLGTGALVAGFALAALTIGWPIAATFSGRLYMRIGFRDTALIGSGLIVVGAVLCVLLTQRAPIWAVAGACFVVGAGLGLASSPTMVAIQSVVGWERRGVVTATNMFCRSIGSAVGAAVFEPSPTPRWLPLRRPAGLGGQPVARQRRRDEPGARRPGRGRTAAVVAFVRTALYDATHNIFLALLLVAVLGVGAMLLMPRRTKELTFD
ncbi:MFS transporter [Streptosporangium lutulentum]